MTQNNSVFLPAVAQALDDDGCEKILDAVWRVLERIGCQVKHEGARKLLADAGCAVEGERHGRHPRRRALDHRPL